MDIIQFISENDVDKSNACISVEMLENAENALGLKFGEELTEYLLKYGYLAFEDIEFYGMNSRQGLTSDMVTQTLYLHKYFPSTSTFVAIENQGDGYYILVNGIDEIYEYNSERNTLNQTGLSLFAFILERFRSL